MILIPIYAPFILIQLSIINIGNLNTLMPVYRTRHLWRDLEERLRWKTFIRNRLFLMRYVMRVIWITDGEAWAVRNTFIACGKDWLWGLTWLMENVIWMILKIILVTFWLWEELFKGNPGSALALQDRFWMHSLILYIYVIAVGTLILRLPEKIIIWFIWARK